VTPKRRNQIILATLLAGLCIWAATVDVPRLSGPIKGDEATYIAQAFSVAKDFDLKYTREDYVRFRQLYGSGPEGVFLKESHDLRVGLQSGWPFVRVDKVPVSTDVELDYGKAFAYGVAAAPFALVFGPGGLLLFNILLLITCAWCAVLFCQARTGRVAGTIIGLAFIGASVVPVYLVWQTSEIFNFSLVFFAYFLWLYKEVALPTTPAWLRDPRVDWAAVALLGIAAFSKPQNAPLIAPIVGLALLRGQWLRGVALGAAFCAVTLGLFGANALISGETSYTSYQGGNRATFHGQFPFDDTGRRFEAGQEMTTNQADEDVFLSPGFLFPHLRYNVEYFLVGRDAGFIPYFFPGFVIALLWLARIRRARLWEWLVAGGLVLAVLITLVLIPFSWNGGGGPIGNRYFLSIYPAVLFLVPAGASVWSGLAALAGGLAIVGAIFLHPFALSRTPWLIPERWPLRELPVEYTLINDIPVFLTGTQRAHILVSKEPEVFFYYMDSNMYGMEGERGFWIRGNSTADIVVRSGQPLTKLELRLRSEIANEVDISLGNKDAPHVTLQPNQEQLVQFGPGDVVETRGYQTLLRITTSAGFYPRDLHPGSTDTRFLGVFVSAKFEAK
jgi:hypothetical protein